MKYIDNFLNYVTMYRLVLYVLIGFLAVAEIFSFFHLLPFNPVDLFSSTIFLTVVCWIANKILAFLFKVQTNIESVFISALILALVITPSSIMFLTFAALITIASKYLINVNKRHIFNPVAFGIWLGGLITGNYASWWIGTASLMPFVVIGGFLIVRKIRREDMVLTFFISALITILGFDVLNKADLLLSVKKIALDTPIIFFASVMLTEPLTTPPTRILQIIYGGIVGVLYCPQIHIGDLYTTPETALLFGNIFSYLVSPKVRLQLFLKEKIQQSTDIYDFIFSSNQRFSFLPGQYMEWTLSHRSPDSRGNRRYFTIASSPTEEDLVLGVRLIKGGSSFKAGLSALSQKGEIVASHIAGDFTLLKDKKKKLVFVAGGIGVTPFRSMVKYLMDTKQKRDIIMLYSAKTLEDFAYKNIFDEAEKVLGIQMVYAITDVKSVPKNWHGIVGRFTPEGIKEKIPDLNERLFYLSGPNAMVESFEKMLKKSGVMHIKKDYFPGFA